MKLLVCGGRSYPDRKRVGETLAQLDAEKPIALLITGGATGADQLAEEWADAKGVARCCFPVTPLRWRAHGRGEGPRRNADMLRFLRPDLVVAFPGGRGTADMVKKARGAGVQVREIR